MTKVRQSWGRQQNVSRGRNLPERNVSRRRGKEAQTSRPGLSTMGDGRCAMGVGCSSLLSRAAEDRVLLSGAWWPLGLYGDVPQYLLSGRPTWDRRRLTGKEGESRSG